MEYLGKNSVIINGEEYIPFSRDDEYDFESLSFIKKEDWNYLIEHYEDDMYRYVTHSIFIYTREDIKECIEEDEY